MITYNAKCEPCGTKVSYQAKMSEREASLPTCPVCKEVMELDFTPNEGGFILKGSGWYKSGGFS